MPSNNLFIALGVQERVHEFTVLPATGDEPELVVRGIILDGRKARGLWERTKVYDKKNDRYTTDTEKYAQQWPKYKLRGGEGLTRGNLRRLFGGQVLRQEDQLIAEFGEPMRFDLRLASTLTYYVSADVWVNKIDGALEDIKQKAVGEQQDEEEEREKNSGTSHGLPTDSALRGKSPNGASEFTVNGESHDL